MKAIDTKSQILEEAGYVYGFDRSVYFNRGSKKVFSVEFIDDHSEDELRRCVSENTGRGEWRFYFNSPPSAAVRRELESVLG